MRRLGAILCLALTLSVAVPQRAAADSIDRVWMVGDEPVGIVIDPTDGRVYVANSKISPADGASIYVVDPSRAPGSPGASMRLATSGAPAILALDPIHRRLYSSNQDRTLQVFDLTTMSLVATLPVGGLGVVVDPSTRRVYVVDVSGSTFSIVAIDGATNTILPQTQSALPREFWWGLAIDPGLHRLYVTNIDTTIRNLVVLDTRDLTRVDALTLPVVPRFALAVDEALHRVYVAGHDPNGLGFGPTMLYALDGSTLATLDSVQVSGFPGGIALAPATHRIYVTNNCACPAEPWGYSEIDDLTFELVRFHATPRPPFLAAMHPDGRLYLGVWNSSVVDELVAISPGNTPPSVSTVTFSPPMPPTDATLHASDDALDVDLPSAPGQSDLTRGYEWWRNGVSIAGETGADLDLTRAGNGDRGDTITVRITVTDRHGSSVSATGSVVIANAAPSVVAALDSVAPRTNDLLRATASSADADGDPVSLAYQWSRNGTAIPGATTATLDLAASGDRGDNIGVRVTGTDGYGGIGTADVSATVTNTAPSTPTLVLSTTAPTTNEVLRATASSIDADGDALVYGFAYYVNERFVWHSGYTSGSVSFDLSLPNWGDRGDAIRVVVVATDGSAESPWSEVSAVVAMTVDVAFSDSTPTTRDTLTATAVVADPGGPALTYTYVWRVNGVVKRTTSATTETTDSLDLATRGVSRQGDLVVCEVLASDGVSTGTGIAQALITNKH
jgi:DNA-binding beta-propeller fold protein YncE